MSQTRAVTDSEGRTWRIHFVSSTGGAASRPIATGQDAPIHGIEFSTHGGPTFRVELQKGELDAMTDRQVLELIGRELERRGR